MLTFEVKDMTCGHCASTIAKAVKAVKAVDRNARIEFDLHAHRVRVESTAADAAELADAIKEAGYSPVPVQPEGAAAKPAKADGCCGGCR